MKSYLERKEIESRVRLGETHGLRFNEFRILQQFDAKGALMIHLFGEGLTGATVESWCGMVKHGDTMKTTIHREGAIAHAVENIDDLCWVCVAEGWG